MSTLDLIRSLRRTMAALREADGPVAVSRIARHLADELEADLDRTPADLADPGIPWATLPPQDVLFRDDGVPMAGAEMAVYP